MAQAGPVAAGDLPSVKWVIFPAVRGSGLLELSYNFRDGVATSGFWIRVAANRHRLAAVAVLSLVIVQVYLLTIGHGFRHHVRPKVTGFDGVGLTPEQAADLDQDEPWRLKG